MSYALSTRKRKMDRLNRKAYYNKGVLQDAFEFRLIDDDIKRVRFPIKTQMIFLKKVFSQFVLASCLAFIFCLYLVVHSIRTLLSRIDPHESPVEAAFPEENIDEAIVAGSHIFN